MRCPMISPPGAIPANSTIDRVAKLHKRAIKVDDSNGSAEKKRNREAKGGRGDQAISKHRIESIERPMMQDCRLRPNLMSG